MTAEENPKAQPARISPRAKLVSTAFAVLAFTWLGWVVHRNGGLATVVGVVERLKWTWPLLLVPYGMLALVVVLTYRACLPNRGREVPFRTLVQIERSGSALNAFLPLGDSSGNIAKVALLRHWYTSEQIVAAGIWNSLGTGIGNAFAALGPAIGGILGVLPPWLAISIAGVNLAMALPASLVLLLVHKGLAARVAKLIGRFPFGFVVRRKARILAWAERLDLHVESAVHVRRADFRNVVFWKVVYQVVRVSHIWMIIELLGLRGGLIAALTYNAMSRTVQQLFVFVPGRMGVTEALSASLFSAIGWPAADGVAMALVLRFNYVINVVFSGTALSGSHALAQKYPPRTAAELEAARLQGTAS